LLSGGSYDTNYYSNDTHYFRGRDALDIHAIIDTTGIKSLGDYKVGSSTVIDASRNLTNINNITSTGNAVFGRTSIDPDSFTNKSGGFGHILDTGWGAHGLFVQGGGLGNAAAIAHNGNNLYFGIQNGSAANSMNTWMVVSPSRAVDMTGSASVALPQITTGTISSGAITTTALTSSGYVKTPTVGMGAGAYTASSISHTAAYREGLFWHTATNYSIARTAGAWSSPDYQQLKLDWPTGIELDGGTAYGKSGVNISAGNFKVGGTTVIDASRNLENIVNASTSKLTLVGSSSANIENYVTGTGTPTTNWRTVGASSNLMTLGSSGGLNIAGSLTQNSDRRIKDNIAPITDALSKTCALQGSTYTRTDEGQDTAKVQAGLIAQDVEAVLPEAVGETNDIKTIDYSSVVALLVESIKELKSEVDDLKTQLSQKEK
jgi:hypothetical protein